MGGGALWHGPSERKPCRFRARSVDRFVLLMSIIMMMAMVATTMMTLMMLMMLMMLMRVMVPVMVARTPGIAIAGCDHDGRAA